MTDDNAGETGAEEIERPLARLDELEEEIIARRAAARRKLVAPREERQALDSKVQLVGDFDAMRAQGVDIPQGGRCLEVGDPIPFDIKLNSEAQEHLYRGNMAWTTSLEDGETARESSSCAGMSTATEPHHRQIRRQG